MKDEVILMKLENALTKASFLKITCSFIFIQVDLLI